tara:strand:+ start:98250 stop:98594 length:345 start_codon:yes stop_codon:yes gene_type:complete
MKTTKKYCFFCDLKDDPILIAEYIEHHKNVWPEILENIEDAGIENMEIYIKSNRLFMIIEVNETFSLEKKKSLDKSNSKVQEWEALMWKYQQVVPAAKEGEKWLLLDQIFKFSI